MVYVNRKGMTMSLNIVITIVVLLVVALILIIVTTDSITNFGGDMHQNVEDSNEHIVDTIDQIVEEDTEDTAPFLIDSSGFDYPLGFVF